MDFTKYNSFDKDDLRRYNVLYYYKAFTETDITNIDNIIKFSQGLIIKDQAMADFYETDESMRDSDLYIRAINDEMSGQYSIYDKELIKQNYQEKNKYYAKLQELYGIDPKESREKEDFYIIKTLNRTLNFNDERLFLESYNEAVNYFKKVTYTKAFNNQVYSREMFYMYLINSTIHRFINKTMYNYFDIENYSKRDLKNAFISNGLDYFDSFPIEYQKRTYKRLNDLIRNKGTNQIFKIIEEIFSLDSININKYYLAKYENDLRFFKTNIDNKLNIYEDPSYGYDELVSKDPYWRNTKSEIIEKAFNVIQTKYISTDSMIDVVNNSKSLSYLFNLIKRVEQGLEDIKVDKESFRFINTDISNSSISLFDSIITLNTLVINYIKYTDRIKEKDMQIQGYNFESDTSSILKDIKNYIYKRQFDKNYIVKYGNLVDNLDIKRFSDMNNFSYEDVILEYKNSDKAKIQMKYISEILNSNNGSEQLNFFIKNDLVIDAMLYLWKQITNPSRNFNFVNISYYNDFMNIFTKFINLMIKDKKIKETDLYNLFRNDISIQQDLKAFVTGINIKFLNSSYKLFLSNKTDSNIEKLINDIYRSIDYAKKHEIYKIDVDIKRYTSLNIFISNIFSYKILDNKEINLSNLIELFEYNEAFRIKLENIILECDDNYLREKFKKLHQQLFNTININKIFKGYATYSDYLKYNNPDLYNFTIVKSDIYNEDTFDREGIYREKIFSLVFSIDNHLNIQQNLFMNNNFVGIINFIRDYITILMTLFKSYTTDIIYTSLLFRLDNKFENSIKLIDDTNINFKSNSVSIDKVNTLDAISIKIK